MITDRDREVIQAAARVLEQVARMGRYGHRDNAMNLSSRLREIAKKEPNPVQVFIERTAHRDFS